MAPVSSVASVVCWDEQCLPRAPTVAVLRADGVDVAYVHSIARWTSASTVRLGLTWLGSPGSTGTLPSGAEVVELVVHRPPSPDRSGVDTPVARFTFHLGIGAFQAPGARRKRSLDRRSLDRRSLDRRSLGIPRATSSRDGGVVLRFGRPVAACTAVADVEMFVQPWSRAHRVLETALKAMAPSPEACRVARHHRRQVPRQL